MLTILLGIPLILSVNDNRVSETSSIIDAKHTAENKDFDKLDTSLFDTYPVLVPPNLILQICLKDTALLDKLHANVNDCNDYACMFLKIIEDDSMKSVASAIKNDTMDNVSQAFKQSIQDCVVWWKLFKHFDAKANSRQELGRCLFQTFASKCREPVLDQIRLLLIAKEER